ncbi:MAG: thioesterase [Chloroflexota bacterium]|nr:thioesterase [Chloroflexota bacterium]
MNKSHRIPFKIRNADCDPYGHLATAQYLQFVHEAEKAVLSLEDLEEPNQLQNSWQPGNTYIQFLLPLVAGNAGALSVQSVSHEDDSRVRAYRFMKDGDNNPSAECYTTWHSVPEETVNIDQLPDYPPITSPEDVQSVENAYAFQQPRLTPKPTGVFSTRRRVQWSDVDEGYQLQYAAYVKYIIDCSILVGDAFGWSVQGSQQEGAGYVARKLWIEYHHPPTLGDELLLSTWVSQLKRSTIIRHYLIEGMDNGKPTATAHILWVSVDMRTGRPMRHPQKFMRGFEGQISE